MTAEPTVDPQAAHFTPVMLANQATLHYDQLDDFEPHHYAFMVSEQELDAGTCRAPSTPTTSPSADAHPVTPAAIATRVAGAMPALPDGATSGAGTGWYRGLRQAGRSAPWMAST